MSDVQPNPRITQYDAPETAPDSYIRRVLCIPVDDDYRIVAAVNDVLAYLTQPEVFNPSENVSEIDMQALMSEMILGYFGELEVMIGAVIPMATDVLPSFMVWCEGQTLLRSNYPELYGRLHANFRLNDDEFIVPDLRSRFVFGYEEGEDDYGITGGAKSVTLTVDQIPSHSHIYEYPSFNLDLESPGAPDILGLGSPGTDYPTSAVGGGQPHNNMPPYVILRYAMVAKWRDCC